MGVPSFYRWLVSKYPKIISDAPGECSDSISPNPNGIEFDNFYLDVNGIIHHCFHPENDNVVLPTCFEDVFKSMYEYIDSLFGIVKPRKLLFLAIDGVVPRAKMDRMRARRFRNAKDAQFAEEMGDKLREQFEKEGKKVFPKTESEVVDPNLITPGTEFMHALSQKLQCCYIRLRMRENPAWANIKVILSDDNVPGEGEHKIMSFIRAQRSSPGYDPNTRHCLYGLDADLIMLALATHEIHFSILREKPLYPVNQFSVIPTMESRIHRAHTCLQNSMQPLRKERSEQASSEPAIELEHLKKSESYHFLHVWVLREYLALDLEITNAKNSEFDLERIIDDFIFICFFAGNDYLSSIPSLEVREGCLDLLMYVYKNEFQNFGGYLVDIRKVEDKNGGYMNLKRVETFILKVGSYEEKIFSKRRQPRGRKPAQNLNENRSELEELLPPVDSDMVVNNTKELNEKLKDCVRNRSYLFKDGVLGPDRVEFGTPGWRERYYEAKFNARNTQEIESARRNLISEYGEGLHWVLLLYFSGVPSWSWFYPYHHAPLASDFEGLSQTSVKFQKGFPFKPFDQLMRVLPPSSAHALPLAYKGLMLDRKSNVIDFYPTEFEIDTDGKGYLWQGIPMLPFIDEERLFSETKKLENELSEREKRRNLESLDRLFFRCSSKESRLLLHCGIKTASRKIKNAMAMESPIEGVRGTIHLTLEDCNRDDDNNHNEEDAKIDLCVFYEINRVHGDVPRLLYHVNIPEKTVSRNDIKETVLWHETNTGHRDNYGGLKSSSWRRDNPVTSNRVFSTQVEDPNGGSSGDWRLKIPRDSQQRSYVRGTGLVQSSNTGAGQGQGTYVCPGRRRVEDTKKGPLQN